MGRSTFAESFDAVATEVLAELFTHELDYANFTLTRANPWEAFSASATTTASTIKSAVLGPGTRRFNGELIEEDRRVVYVDRVSLTVTPDTGTKITIDGEEHSVLRVVGYPEGALPSLWEIDCGIA